MSMGWVVFLKEMRETLRDRRTLLVMIAVPVLLYPLLLIASEQMLLVGMRNLEADRAPVAVVGEPTNELLTLVDSSGTLRRVPISGDPEAKNRISLE